MSQRILGAIATIQLPGMGIGYNGRPQYAINKFFEDFEELTLNQVVIMGRKTLETLPKKRRPLPDRVNIIVSSNQKIIEVSETNFVAESPEAAFGLALKKFPDKNIWVAGGGTIYDALLDKLNMLYLTKVTGTKPSDTFFPDYTHLFDEVDIRPFTDEQQKISYDMVIAKR